MLVSGTLSQDSRVLYQIYPTISWAYGAVTAGATLPLRAPPPPALLVDTSPVLFSTLGTADTQNRQLFVRNASGVPLTFTAHASNGHSLKSILPTYPFVAD